MERERERERSCIIARRDTGRERKERQTFGEKEKQISVTERMVR